MYVFERFDGSAVEKRSLCEFLYKQFNQGILCNWPYSLQQMSYTFVFLVQPCFEEKIIIGGRLGLLFKSYGAGFKHFGYWLID